MSVAVGVVLIILFALWLVSAVWLRASAALLVPAAFVSLVAGILSLTATSRGFRIAVGVVTILEAVVAVVMIMIAIKNSRGSGDGLMKAAAAFMLAVFVVLLTLGVLQLTINA